MLRPPVIESPLPANIFRPPQTRANYFYYRIVIASSTKNSPIRYKTNNLVNLRVNILFLDLQQPSSTIDEKRDDKKSRIEGAGSIFPVGRNGAKGPLPRDFRVRPISEEGDKLQLEPEGFEMENAARRRMEMLAGCILYAVCCKGAELTCLDTSL